MPPTLPNLFPAIASSFLVAARGPGGEWHGGTEEGGETLTQSTDGRECIWEMTELLPIGGRIA